MNNKVFSFLPPVPPLSDVLAVGNTTKDGQTIKALNGGSVLDLRFAGTDSFIFLGNDTTGNKGYLIMNDGSFVQLGFNGPQGYYIDFGPQFGVLRVNNIPSYSAIDPASVGMRANATYNNTQIHAISVHSSIVGDTVANGGQNAVFINSGNNPDLSVFLQNVDRSVIAAGKGITAKTDDTLYTNQMSLQESGNTFDAILKSGTITSDREYTLPDQSGEVLLDSSPIPAGAMYISTPAVTNIPAVNTPIQIAGTYSTEFLTDFSSPSNGVLRYDGANTRVFEVNVSASVDAVAFQRLFSFYIVKNGTIISQSRQQRRLFPTNDIGSVSVLCLIELSTGDEVQIFTENNDNGSNVTFNFLYATIK